MAAGNPQTVSGLMAGAADTTTTNNRTMSENNNTPVLPPPMPALPPGVMPPMLPPPPGKDLFIQDVDLNFLENVFVELCSLEHDSMTKNSVSVTFRLRDCKTELFT